MKKTFYLIFVLAFAFIVNTFGQKQTIELAFTAQYQTQYVMLDSIYIENLTQGGDTILYAPDSVLVLDFVTGIAANPALNEGFCVSQNRPNPFTEQTIINIFLPEADHLHLSVINLLGQKVAIFENSLDAGNYSFVFYPGEDRSYILTATVNGLTKTIKMVSINNHSAKQLSLNYKGAVETHARNKSSLDINDFVYTLGDHLRFIGFAKNISDIVGSDVIEDAPTSNEFYEFTIIEGIPCPDIPLIYYEDEIYPTVQIGNQCWMKKNLNNGYFITGPGSNNGQLEKMCYFNQEYNCQVYGGLYEWGEIMEYNINPGIQGVCPEGWHIPTVDEWGILNDYLGDDSIAGGKLKETGFQHWMEPNTGATNESGFMARGSGTCIDYIYDDLEIATYFWSSSIYETNGAWIRKLYRDDTYFLQTPYPYTSNISVRCLKDVTGTTIPTVGTWEIYNITQTSGTGGGNITEDGGAPVTARGVCWSTTQIPTLDDNHTINGSGLGSFESIITGLSNETKYYVRAYATNSMGTAYGNQVTFFTYMTGAGEPCPGIPTVYYEGQAYSTVLIGDQCWFRDNLKVGTMIWEFQEMTNNGIIEKYCYNNQNGNCNTYGGLYQWNEMMQYTTINGTQGICPAGWHIPSDTDWCSLAQFIDPTVNCNTTSTGTDIGLKMKSTSNWNSGGNGTNVSGFRALPAGSVISEDFDELGESANFWTSTESNINKSWNWELWYASQHIERDYTGKTAGFSVRCIKD